jgi:methionyl-tRNA formyltransferase
MSTRPALTIIFAGTPEFAAEHLKALCASRHRVIAVYTQPDRPAGRGKKLSASPVKELALAQQIAVYQPVNFKSAAAQSELAALGADLMVVVAYGLLLPKAILESPRLGCLNVHGSLLPRWRGAAPIQRALAAGDSETGITIMQMDEGLDTGAMLLKVACPILATDTGASLQERLVKIGPSALLEAIDQLQAGSHKPCPQDDCQSNYAAKLSKEEAALNWRRPALELERQVRAFNPFPIAHAQVLGAGEAGRLRVWAAKAVEQTSGAAPGSITQISAAGLWIACAEGQLILEQLQLPGKKILPVHELVRGHADLLRVGGQLEVPAA